MRRDRLSRHRTTPGPFGPMRISYDRYPSIMAMIEAPGTPPVTVVPGRSLVVDGQRVHPVRERSRWDLRRAARARTLHAAGHRYELRQTGLFRARFTRDGALVADARGSVRAYLPFLSFPGIIARLTFAPGITPADAAIAQAMILTFGAGAPGLLARIAFIWLEWYDAFPLMSG